MFIFKRSACHHSTLCTAFSVPARQQLSEPMRRELLANRASVDHDEIAGVMTRAKSRKSHLSLRSMSHPRSNEYVAFDD